ncbi:membrane protein [Clostridium carboxidivorans P7]|uniref:LemA family protein n=1 Tax=Clostridium carboxidivorans P7 TaxID=536227 RepID=C6PYI6_9CLOT|nr:LemA family protein [Clostridium carboxidivorans]AKN29712.1 membrane protein [Clostridium carboxidivorans P7]EET85705.1 LemA family protein [Clostridium carboxidivorans P7]EFG89346.1 LemA family protein [Clostridium carboxidivorans P7]
MIILIIALVILIPIIWGVSAYNKLIKDRLKVDNQWSQIDVQLKMRSDLIPNLVETVSGYAQHEKETLGEVTNARVRYLSAENPGDIMKASEEMSKTLSRLMAVAEAYPDLKANTNFLELQRELSTIEKRIADYRQFYNDTVLRYNQEISTVPSNIIAKLFNFHEKEFLEVTDEDKVRPNVKFTH